MAQQSSLDQLLGIIGSVFDAYSTVLFQKGADGSCGVVSFFSLGDNVMRDCRIKPGNGLVGWVLEHNKPLLVSHFNRQSGCLGYYTSEGESTIKSFMGMPLDEKCGVLCVDSKKTYSFTEKDQKILHQFSRMITGLFRDLENASCFGSRDAYFQALLGMWALRDKSLRWRDFLDRLLQLISQATGFENVLLAVRSESGESYEIEGRTGRIFPREELHEGLWPLGAGLIGWVFNNNTALYRSDVESGAVDIPLFGRETMALAHRSVACLPVSVDRTVRAVLCVASAQKRCIDTPMKGFCSATAGFLSQHLENLYFRGRLSALRQINNSLQTTE